MKEILLAILVALPLAASAQVPAYVLADTLCPETPFVIHHEGRPDHQLSWMPPSENSTAPDTFIYVGQQPVPLNMTDVKKKIKYPWLMRDAGIQGKVVVKVLVDKEGYTVACMVLKTPHRLFCSEVLQYIHELRFTPAKDGDGFPVKVWVAIPFDFKLK